MTGQRRSCALRFACIAFAVCLPLDDLSGYTGDGVAPFAGGTSAGGAAGAGSAGAASGGAAVGEGMGGTLPLGSAGTGGAGAAAGAWADAGGSSPLPTRAPDAGACNAEGEFAGVAGASCYRLTADTAVWLDARAACQSWGGDLVQIESAAEDDFLTARLTVDVWIGLSDRETEGTMLWVDASAPVFTHWGNAQPDDFNAQEDCGEKRVGDAGGWNDRPCDGEPQAYLCER
ncbi:MAG TPA: C-type lectin domain-containing protein [Polyangiaceae bacterium]|nr:C-type lectin domain-containing protein [Polyangiaceae bacterium]